MRTYRPRRLEPIRNCFIMKLDGKLSHFNSIFFLAMGPICVKKQHKTDFRPIHINDAEKCIYEL